MKITSKWVKSLRGITGEQRDLLGVGRQPTKGWKKRLVGQEISDFVAQKVVALGNKRRLAKSRPYPVHKRGNRTGRVDYFTYIESPAWQKKRREAFARYGRKCSTCGSGERLHVHHKTYERLGRERLADLQVLCADCHAIEHEKKGVLTSLDREFRQLIS